LDSRITVNFKNPNNTTVPIAKTNLSINDIFNTFITEQNYSNTQLEDVDINKIFFTREISSFPKLAVDNFGNFELSGFIIDVMTKLTKPGVDVSNRNFAT
jgi:hypothetical protein